MKTHRFSSWTTIIALLPAICNGPTLFAFELGANGDVCVDHMTFDLAMNPSSPAIRLNPYGANDYCSRDNSYWAISLGNKAVYKFDDPAFCPKEASRTITIPAFKNLSNGAT